MKSEEPGGELVSRPIPPPDPSHMPKDKSPAACPEARHITGDGDEGSSRGRGAERQCRDMAMEDVTAQASDRRETMTYSHNVNGDFKFIYFCGETLAGVTRQNSRFISADCPAGQETQNLHPLI